MACASSSPSHAPITPGVQPPCRPHVVAARLPGPTPVCFAATAFVNTSYYYMPRDIRTCVTCAPSGRSGRTHRLSNNVLATKQPCQAPDAEDAVSRARFPEPLLAGLPTDAEVSH